MTIIISSHRLGIAAPETVWSVEISDAVVSNADNSAICERGATPKVSKRCLQSYAYKVGTPFAAICRINLNFSLFDIFVSASASIASTQNIIRRNT